MFYKRFQHGYFIEVSQVTDKGKEELDKDYFPRKLPSAPKTPFLYSKTHESGWTVIGQIERHSQGFSSSCLHSEPSWFDTSFYWVGQFEAVHPVYGNVRGDFSLEVYADTKEGFDNFYSNHPPEFWKDRPKHS